MKTVQKKIPLEKRYDFPKKLKIIRFASKILIISVDTANWIVLENENQLNFFNLLEENSIETALSLFKGEKLDAQKNVIQLEAKNFESKHTVRTDKNKIMMYLTNGCNMRCPHCYMYAGSKNDNELTAKEIITFLLKIKKTGISTITFSGGEVCTRSDFSEIINRAFEIGFEIEVLTNGTLWTDEMIDFLSPKIEKIQISVDGFCEEENAIIRGKGNFEKALLTVEKFVNHGVNTKVAITPFFEKKLENKIDAYAKFANDLIQKYKDKNFSVIFTGELINGREVELKPDTNAKYAEIIDKIYQKTTHFSGKSAFVSRRKNKEILDNCSFGNLYISSNGEVFACSRIGDVKPFANLRKDDISKILKLAEKAKQISNVENLEPCRHCELKFICGGGCRLVHFSEISKINPESPKILKRNCSQKEKEYFYKLMLETNEDLFE